jgi:hypothetical protein
MRSLLGLAASALGGLAAVIASLDQGIAPFFVGLTFLGGVEAWAAHAPFVGQRRWVARGVALLWLGAGVVVGAGLVMYLLVEHIGPEPGPQATYLGLTATVYNLIGLYVGAVLVLFSAFGSERWFQRSGT